MLINTSEIGNFFLFSDHSLTFFDWMLRATVGFIFMLISVS